jgi:hypothetical protein
MDAHKPHLQLDGPCHFDCSSTKSNLVLLEERPRLPKDISFSLGSFIRFSLGLPILSCIVVLVLEEWRDLRGAVGVDYKVQISRMLALDLVTLYS